MTRYIVRRFLYMIVLLVMISVAAFAIMQLPPGDFVEALVTRMELFTGSQMTEEAVQALRRQYGVDRPMIVQYLRWAGNLLRGDLGRSFLYEKPVARIIAARLPLTMLVAVFTIVFTYVVAIPVGIYSATHQYSIVDYTVTAVGFVGLATPNFCWRSSSCSCSSSTSISRQSGCSPPISRISLGRGPNSRTCSSIFPFR